MNSPAASRSLPDLGKLLTGTNIRLPNEQSKTQGIQSKLMELAIRLRQKQIIPFFSTREVAEFFKVSHVLVARIFSSMEEKGLIRQIRGKGTFLLPGKPSPTSPVHGVVGIPLWQYGFCVSCEWRHFYKSMEMELRKKYFISNTLFHGVQHNASDRSFVEYLISHRLDYLVWFKPLPSYIHNLLTLQDTGTKIIVITDNELKYPFTTYRIEIRNGLFKCLRNWKSSGFNHLIIPIHPSSQPWYEKVIIPLLSSRGFTFEPFLVSIEAGDSSRPHSIKKLFKRLLNAKNNEGLFLLDHLINWELTHNYQTQLLKCIGHVRTLISEQMDVNSHYAEGITVDSICVNWADVASQIAQDVATGKWRESPLQIIEPPYRPCVNLSGLSLIW